MKGVAEQLRILITSRIHNCLYHSVCVTCRFESWKTLEKSWKGKKQRPWSCGWTLDFRQSRRTCAAVVQHQRCEETHTYVHCTRCSFGSKQQLLLSQQPFNCESFFAFCPWDTARLAFSSHSAHVQKKEDMTIEVIHPHKQGCFLMCSQHTTTQLSITADTGSYGAELSWLRGLYLSTSASYSNFQALLLKIIYTPPLPQKWKHQVGVTHVWFLQKKNTQADAVWVLQDDFMPHKASWKKRYEFCFRFIIANFDCTLWTKKKKTASQRQMELQQLLDFAAKKKNPRPALPGSTAPSASYSAAPRRRRGASAWADTAEERHWAHIAALQRRLHRHCPAGRAACGSASEPGDVWKGLNTKRKTQM